MKYRIGSLTIEAIDTYVRATVEHIGGPDAPPRVAVTQRELPTAIEVARLVAELRGCWPDRAVLQACGRAAADARSNKLEWDATIPH